MELNSVAWPIQKILGSKNTYFVPEYQRQFSWSDKREVKELFDDVLNHIKIVDDSLRTEEYFLGTMIFQGDITAAASLKRKIYVIDGQQRLTAITIFLRALSDCFAKIDQSTLADAIRKNYIFGQDDNGNNFPIFTNETPQPFFRAVIQQGQNAKPTTDEEDRIDAAYKYFMKRMAASSIKSRFCKSNGTHCDLVEIYKAIRDQLLSCIVIAIWTTDAQYANSIFEIMNAKGLELAPLDLIKNRIFSLCKNEGDVASIENAWKKVSSSLSQDEKRIPFDLFFSHYWVARFGTKAKKNLYDDFSKKMKKYDDCIELLGDLYVYSLVYRKCLYPSLLSFENKRQYASVVTYLNFLSRRLNLVMPRPFLIVLYRKYETGQITGKQLRNTLFFLSKYHFIYSAICSLRTNAIEKHYIDAAKDLYSSPDSSNIETVISGLKTNLIKKIPSLEVFKQKIGAVKFSNKCDKYNKDSRAKFFCAWLTTETNSPEIFEPEDFSVEHVLGDSVEDSDSLLIQFLLPLERKPNSELLASCIKDKAVVYSQSRYPYTAAVGKKLAEYDNEEQIKAFLKKEFSDNCDRFYNSIVPSKTNS